MCPFSITQKPDPHDNPATLCDYENKTSVPILPAGCLPGVGKESNECEKPPLSSPLTGPASSAMLTISPYYLGMRVARLEDSAICLITGPTGILPLTTRPPWPSLCLHGSATLHLAAYCRHPGDGPPITASAQGRALGHLQEQERDRKCEHHV